jgi:pilus assembly protein CpaF
MTGVDPFTALVYEVCRRVSDHQGDAADLVADEVQRLAPLHDPADQRRLTAAALAHLVGLGELDDLLADDDVDEVLVNAGGQVWIDRRGTLEPARALPAGRLDLLVERILAPLGRRLDRTSPIVDARLADGSRLCAVLTPIAVDGSALAIRRFTPRHLDLNDFLDPEDTCGHDLLRDVVDSRCNVIVSGATSSGKTSLVGVLVGHVAADERIVLVEDTAELHVTHPHVVRLEARPGSIDGPHAIEVTDLVRTALRLRPDRIVVGEVRGDEVLGLVNAMNTGHDGSISTCHANGPLDSLLRLETLVLQAAPTWPLAAIRQQIRRSIDVVVHVARVRDTAQRRVAAVAEVAMPHGGDPGDDATRWLTELASRHADGPLEMVSALTRTHHRLHHRPQSPVVQRSPEV